jgi:hypothetical protein
MDEIAVGIGLVLFGYAAYSALKTPSDFSSQVLANPRKKVEASPPPAKAPAKKEAAPAAVAKAPPAAAKVPPPAAKAPPPAAPAAKAPPPAEVVAPAETAEPVAAEAPVAAAVAEAPVAEAAPEAQEPRTVVMLKNPTTGEIAPLPADYRFAKKWIKDALVSEGLLDRIYKNSELDRKNRTRIREALERLRAMPKYGV